MAKLGIGFVGAGGIAGAHAASLMRIKQAKIEKIMDVNPEAAEKLAERTGAAVAKSVDDIIEDEKIEAVYVLTPPQFHRKYFALAAKAGKKIFVEKPLAHTVEDGRVMVSVQKRTGAFAMVGFVLRFHPLWSTLKKLVAGGAIGELKSIWNMRTSCWEPFGWFRDPALGGLLKDFNAHDVDFMRWLVGAEIKDARGYCQSLYEGNISEDNLTLSIRFKNGVTAALNSSWYVKGSNYCIVIAGTKGALYASADDYNPSFIYQYDKNNRKKKVKLKQNVDMFLEEDRDFVCRAITAQEPSVTALEAFESLKMTHQLYRSMEFVK